jgi:hypothetical protein
LKVYKVYKDSCLVSTLEKHSKDETKLLYLKYLEKDVRSSTGSNANQQTFMLMIEVVNIDNNFIEIFERLYSKP